MPFRVLVFGDVVGRSGRQAIKKILPRWKKLYRPDLIVANVENLAHGSGITPKTLRDLSEAGVQIFTGGDHSFAKAEADELLNQPDSPLLRPANLLKKLPGQGEKLFNIASQPVLVINLLGKVFIEEKMEKQGVAVENPFRAVEKILERHAAVKDKIILVDFHTEATSEQVAMGYFLDGRVSALWGTHTHVPTADAAILENGAGFITDIGMTGASGTVLGVDKNAVIKRFLNDDQSRFDWPETARATINALYLEIDAKTKKTKKIKLLQKEITLN